MVKPRVRVASDGSYSLEITPAHMSEYMPPPSHVYGDFNGEKFAGGFGDTAILGMDYWELRAKSAQLFSENLYAAGIIRRLITNGINTGLTPEACPDEQILGLPVDSLNDWTEIAENQFALWGKSPTVCDAARQKTFGALQRDAQQEALIEGDVLVVLSVGPTGMPAVRLISGSTVATPWTQSDGQPAEGNEILDGVEITPTGAHAAYWVRQRGGEFKRLPAYGEKTGRRVAWMVYGVQRRINRTRGVPLLALVLQSLKEIDRYRDSTQRKAVINSLLAMFIEKTQDKASTLPLTGGATRHGTTTAAATTTAAPRRVKTLGALPGMVMEELQTGEKPVLLGGQGTDMNFGDFEAAILSGIAWGLEIPPEILTLAFSNNYSASQAAINEFKIYLNRVWSEFGESFCSPVYVEVLLSLALTNRIKATGLLRAWRDPLAYDQLAAWVAVDWYGSIKPSTDMLKQVKASALLVDGGFSTRAREARITTGTKYSKNIQRVARENAQLAAALTPMLELRQKYQIGDNATALADVIDEAIADAAGL
jgi:lambda family phage portal protein